MVEILWILVGMGKRAVWDSEVLCRNDRTQGAYIFDIL